MWWFALIIFVNALVPSNVLYDQFGFYVAGFRATPLDVILFAGPVLTLLPAWRRQAMPVERAHRLYRTLLILFVLSFIVAAILGASHASSLWRPQWYFAPLRNFLIVPVAMYMGHQVLRNPGQCRRAVWLIFLSSLAAAIAMVVLGGQATADMAGGLGSFEQLRETRAQASGETGQIAASMVVFSLAAGVPFLPLPLALMALATCGVGMLFAAHRSMWLTSAAVLAYAGAVLHKARRVRSIMVSLALLAAMIFGIVIVVGVVSQRTGRDFGAWVVTRLHSFLPDDQAYTARAWDSRVPGMWIDLAICAEYPLLGGGFGVHEAHSMRTGESASTRHTPWTSTLAESGVIGLAAFALAVGGMIVLGTRLARTGLDRWMMLLGAGVACHGVSAFILGWVSLSWNSPRQAIMLGLLLGLVLRCRELALAMEANQRAVAESNFVVPPLARADEL